MSLKSWVINRMRRSRDARGLLSRVDLPPRDTVFEPTLAGHAAGEPAWDHRSGGSASGHIRAAEPMLAAHLGAYAPLIGAIRQELEHFIISQLRLHLAIADRDRYVLTSIAVTCADDDEAHERLRRFMHEFKPEQVKRYLAREVIAGLPNAAAIDLSQFAGLVDGATLEDDDEDDYGDLLAELGGLTDDGAPPYEVTLIGRWSEIDASAAVRAAAPAPAAASAALVTPLAGQRCEFDVEDAEGRRRVVLPAVVPGRRYVIGQGPGCDIPVRGTYTSRRHAELWHDQGAWWVADAGSTNGLRVEQAGNLPQTLLPTAAGEGATPLRLGDGARLVLSARSEGPPADCPWLALHGAAAAAAARVTPIAAPAAPRTPLTAIRGTDAPSDAAFEIAPAGGGAALLKLRPAALPLAVGRSRQCALMIERRHDGVSGHHLDIVALDPGGVELQVLGDNGVLLDGVHHRAGSRLHWAEGHAMVLGAAAHDPSACALVLRRANGA
jgi:hypothetical protein